MTAPDASLIESAADEEVELAELWVAEAPLSFVAEAASEEPEEDELLLSLLEELSVEEALAPDPVWLAEAPEPVTTEAPVATPPPPTTTVVELPTLARKELLPMKTVLMPDGRPDDRLDTWLRTQQVSELYSPGGIVANVGCEVMAAGRSGWLVTATAALESVGWPVTTPRELVSERKFVRVLE